MLSAKLYKASVKESSKDNSYDPNQMIIGNKAGAQSITQAAQQSLVLGIPQLRPLPVPIPINSQMSGMTKRHNISNILTGAVAASKSTNRDVTNNNSLSSLTINNPLSENKLQILSRQTRQQANLLQSKSTLSNSSPNKGGKIVESTVCAPLFSKPQDSESNPIFALKTSPSKLHVKEAVASQKRPPSQYLNSNSVSPTKITNNNNFQSALDFSYFPEMNIQQQQQEVSSLNFFSITSTADEPAVNFSDTSTHNNGLSMGKGQIYKSPSIQNNADQNKQLECPPYFQVLPSKRNTQISPLKGQEFSRARNNLIEKTGSSQSLQQQQSQMDHQKKATFIGAHSNIIPTDCNSATKKGFIIKPHYDNQYPKVGFQEYELQTAKVSSAPQMKSSITSQMLSANNRLATLKIEQIKNINDSAAQYQQSMDNVYHHNSNLSGINNDPQSSPLITISNGRNTTFNYMLVQNHNEAVTPQLHFNSMSFDDMPCVPNQSSTIQTVSSPKDSQFVKNTFLFPQAQGTFSQQIAINNVPFEYTNINEDLTSRISQQSYNHVGLLSSTLKQSILIPKTASDPKSNSEKPKRKEITSPLLLVANNDAVYKQTQLYRQLQEHNKIQQQVKSGQNKNKRIVLAANSSHFRHSSNTIKKQLLAQAVASNNGGLILGPSSKMMGPPLHLIPQDMKKGNEFNYKVIPSISYESQNISKSVLPLGATTSANENSAEKSNNNQIAGGSGNKKFGALQNHAVKGIDDFNKELQSIIEKEKQLTEEIIRNSLVKPNGRFNFEALAHLNDIMESKKNIKKRFAIAENSNIQSTQGDPLMLIQSYSGQKKESNAEEEAGDGIPQDCAPNSDRLTLMDQKVIGSAMKTRASDNFLKQHFGRQKAAAIGSPTSAQNQQPSAFQDSEGNQQVMSSLSASSPAPKPQQQQKQKKKPARVATSQGNKNSCKIKIYHKEDHSMKHIQEHPINKAIQKINYLVRLIFKGMNVTVDSQQKAQVGGQGSQLQSQKSASDIHPHMILFSTSDLAQQQQQANQQTALQQHLNEEKRLQEIERVSAKWFNINIPMKKLESKAAHREYFQSRDFIYMLKTKFNALLHGTLNKHNKMTELVQQMQQHQNNSGVQFQRFFVGWGNNFEIVKQVLKTRTWWQQSNNEDFSEVAFMWTSWKKQQHIDYLSGGSYFTTAVGGQILNQSASFATDEDCKVALTTIQKSGQNNQKCLKNSVENGCFKLYNRMEQNKQLTNKKGVFLNMRDYYYMSGMDPFEVLPLTFLIKPAKNGDSDFQRFQTFYNNIAAQAKENVQNCQIAIEQRVREIRFECAQRRKREERERQMALIFKKQPSQKTTNKKPTRLPRSGSKIQCYDDNSESMEMSEYDEDQKRIDEEQRIIDNDQKIKDIKARYPEVRNIWIVKPGENTNRGNGIEVCSDINQIRRLVSNAKDGANGQDSTFIIQRYIDNPLLIHARKFDFRCYGMLTSINGLLKGYFYEDAYIRTSCKEFDIEDVHNKYIHLTNDAVQKFSQDYGKYENGNKLSLSDFQRYLKTHHPSLNVDVYRHIMPQIRKLVTDSYRSVYGKIDPMRLHNTFELFGYDFMLDADFRLYLIEVNTNPCLETSCPLLARIIPDVLDNTFRLVLDPMYPSPEGFNPRKTQQAPQEIKFTLVFDEEMDGPSLLKLKQAEGPSTSGNTGTDDIESDNEEDDQQPQILVVEQKGHSQQSTGE